MPVWLIPLLRKLEPVIAWIFILTLFGWMSYVTFIKPHTNPTPTNVQSGGTSYNYEIKVGMGGCARLPVVPNK